MFEPAEATAAALERLVAEGRQFGAIYADPPWSYGNLSTRGSTKPQADRAGYPTMSMADLLAMPVAKLAAPQSHLWLWTTAPMIKEAWELMEAWGFTYKTQAIWTKSCNTGCPACGLAKVRLGMGNYLRVSHEHLYLGVRGGLRTQDMTLCSSFSFPRMEHSAKPPFVRDMVERGSPWPWLELFGRKPADGWVVWGNEIPGCVADKQGDGVPPWKTDRVKHTSDRKKDAQEKATAKKRKAAAVMADAAQTA